MSITLPRVEFPSRSLREWRGGLISRPACLFFVRHRQACKHSVNDRSKPLHERSSCPQTGARHAEHRPPGFPAFHAYGAQ